MSHGFHGKSIEEIVDLRFKEYEIRQAREREQLAALHKAQAENKQDVTAPKAEKPPHVSVVAKVLHKLHLD
jgi:hypothetical protein